MEVNDFKIEKIPLPVGIHTTTCLICNRTCHDNCGIPNDSDKRGCVAMSNGNCTRCLNKCYWDKHANLPFIYKETTVKTKKTISELEKLYQQSLNDANETGSLLKNIFTVIQGFQKQIIQKRL